MKAFSAGRWGLVGILFVGTLWSCACSRAGQKGDNDPPPAEPRLVSTKRYPGPTGSWGGLGVTGQQGELVLVGSQFSRRGDGDGLMLLLDRDGTQSWSRTGGGRQSDSLMSVVPLGDGRFVAVGSTSYRGPGRTDGWVLCFDRRGRILWERIWGGVLDDTLLQVVRDREADTLWATGWSERRDGDRQLWLIRFSTQGELQIDRVEGGKFANRGLALLSLADGGVLVGGRSGTGIATADGALWHFDARGALKRRRSVRVADWTELRQIVRRPSGEILLVGNTNRLLEVRSWGFIAGFDAASLRKRWLKLLPGERRRQVVSVLDWNAELLVLGQQNSKDGVDGQSWLGLLDQNRHWRWSRWLGDIRAGALIPLGWRRFVVSGWQQQRHGELIVLRWNVGSACIHNRCR